mmetsp:Transcript_14146/g.22553  ORF Transcript_14146/g.22553 Transcript_14146/m.22553 type:complete len:220 (-) Transcript_14146:106-765(-)
MGTRIIFTATIYDFLLNCVIIIIIHLLLLYHRIFAIVTAFHLHVRYATSFCLLRDPILLCRLLIGVFLLDNDASLLRVNRHILTSCTNLPLEPFPQGCSCGFVLICRGGFYLWLWSSSSSSSTLLFHNVGLPMPCIDAEYQIPRKFRIFFLSLLVPLSQFILSLIPGTPRLVSLPPSHQNSVLFIPEFVEEDGQASQVDFVVFSEISTEEREKPLQHVT